ncbi:hypothetical protein MAGR_56520 [Mycolicibacterium agri]|uniref:Insertion element IS150 protein InsJ-like helix-turn-helix domain-containing protein n=1 Tax=Mycolicibacterium agri TaxID=36811 RepID=A0A7I9W935_MYCAG|nr:helix-turn-helix domain-containing protein [Mycolicibacterium agri]GFG54211.1 hypothetical protein MAGR_56520 [Mycolicibacterium agri]
MREIAAGTHTDPFGNQVRISRETLDRWIRRYRAGGFEALVPARGGWRAHRCAGARAGGVAKAGKPHPHGGAGGPDPAHRHRVGAFESTLLRYFHKMELMGGPR